MAHLPFTLAALATSAVPGLVVFGARAHDGGESFTSAVVATADTELLVAIPRTQQAEVQQSAELLGLAALTEGPRGRLPFVVPESLGMTRAGDTRAVVSTYVDGDTITAEDLTADALLLEPIAAAIAAVHQLPHSVAIQGGLPVRTASELRQRAVRLMERAEATRLLPDTVLSRWRAATQQDDLWDFSPALVHGDLNASHLRVWDDQVSGVLGWSELAIGDPASDLSWLLAADPEVLGEVLRRYTKKRNAGTSTGLRARAALYHEFEVAKWLLHGVDTHDTEVIDDAVSMLDRMVGSVGVLAAVLAETTHHEPLTEDEVSVLLDHTPEVTDHMSETAAYDALDEDRTFLADTDFIDPLPDSNASEAAPVKEAAPARETAPAPETAPASTQEPELSDDQLTAPIADSDLPDVSPTDGR